MSQPDYFKLMGEITAKRAEELKRACFTCHEDTSETVMLCAKHAATDALLEALERMLNAEQEDYDRMPESPIRRSYETNGHVREQARAALALARPTQDDLGATPRRREEQEPR